MKRNLCTYLLVVSLAAMMLPAGRLSAAEFYIDPVQGDPANAGSVARPWKSLQAVIDRGLVESRQWDALPYKRDKKLVPRNPDARIKAGDTIWLRTGDYGDLKIESYYNTGPVTIAAAQGHTPRFRSILVRSSSHWTLRGLHVSPEYGEGKKPSHLVWLNAHGWRGPIHDIAVEGCVLRSAGDTSNWLVEDWNARACNGIEVDGTRMTIQSNRLTNVNFGISVGASHSVVAHNHVENFSGDGLRGLGDYSQFLHNTVKNCYDVNGNHDDGFQSWSHGPKGVGTGEVKGLVIRGNTIINYEDPDQPHRGALQGIGCFDGMFVDWVVENNVIVVDHYHGLTLLGARGCRIVNNTVIDPNAVRPGPAAIRIAKHKKGMLSSGCTVRGNRASALHVDKEGAGMIEADNVIVTNPEEVFVDPERGDFRLKVDGAAVDVGVSKTRQIIILKLDDITTNGAGDGLPVSPRWQRMADFLASKNISAGFGIIGHFIEGDNPAFFKWIKDLHATGRIEFWNHGYHNRQTSDPRGEFEGPFKQQLAALKRTQVLCRERLGIVPHAFGPHWSGTNADTAKALEEVPELTSWFYGDATSSTKHVFPRILVLENPIFVPDAEKFKELYEGRGKDEPCLALQGHPNGWDDARWEGFVQIIRFLQSRDCVFMTPSGYLAKMEAEGR